MIERYVVEIYTENGIRYAYRGRLTVRSLEMALRFETVSLARSYARRNKLLPYEVVDLCKPIDQRTECYRKYLAERGQVIKSIVDDIRNAKL